MSHYDDPGPSNLPILVPCSTCDALRAKLQAAEQRAEGMECAGAEQAARADQNQKEMLEWRDRAEAAEAKMDNLAALVRLLVHNIRKFNIDNVPATRAMDYLNRTGLTGSILRDDEVKP